MTRNRTRRPRPRPRPNPARRPVPDLPGPGRDPRRGGRHKRRKVGVLEGNPAIVRGILVAVLALLAAAGFGWAADVDEETVTAYAILIATLGPVATAIWTRFAVTPNVKVIARTTTDGRVVAGDAAVLPTGTQVPTERDGPAVDVHPIEVHPDRLNLEG